MVMHPVLLKTINNLIVLLMGVIVLAFLMRGFIVPYLRVKASMGKKVLVKITQMNTDIFRVGDIIEKELVYKYKSNDSINGIKRLTISDTSVFYRMMGVSCVDVDAVKNAIVSRPDFKTVPGFDAVRQENLLVRALTKPTILESQEKIIMLLVIVCVVVVVISLIINLKLYKDMSMIKNFLGASSNIISSGV